MKRSQRGDADFPRGPIWERPTKRREMFLMRLDVSVPGVSEPVRAVVDPWTPIHAVISDVSVQASLPPISRKTLFINNTRCYPAHQVSRYTNTAVTPAHLVIETVDDLPTWAELFGEDAGRALEDPLIWDAMFGANSPSNDIRADEPLSGAAAPSDAAPSASDATRDDAATSAPLTGAAAPPGAPGTSRTAAPTSSDAARDDAPTESPGSEHTDIE